MAQTGDWFSERNAALANSAEALYAERPDILFHDFGHAVFVAGKAAQAAPELGCTWEETELVQAAGLTHDFNYLVDVQSDPEVGEPLRRASRRATSAGSPPTWQSSKMCWSP